MLSARLRDFMKVGYICLEVWQLRFRIISPSMAIRIPFCLLGMVDMAAFMLFCVLAAWIKLCLAVSRVLHVFVFDQYTLIV